MEYSFAGKSTNYGLLGIVLKLSTLPSRIVNLCAASYGSFGIKSIFLIL